MSDDSAGVRVPTGREDTSVLFTAPSLPFDDEFVDFEVHIDAPGLTVRNWTRTAGGDGMAAFFTRMVSDFHGWKGPRLWRSFEGDLTIEATHTGHHVALLISLSSESRDYDADAWTVVVPATVLPGEELRQLAADVHDFLRKALAVGS